LYLVGGQSLPSSTPLESAGFSGYYISSGDDPYLTTSALVYYTITLVNGSYYTLYNGEYYITAEVGDNGFDQDSANPYYNQFSLIPVSGETNQYYIYSPYLNGYNGYGYLCGDSTPYGPYLEFCDGESTSASWIVTTSTPTPSPYTVPSSSPIEGSGSAAGYYIICNDPYLGTTGDSYSFNPVSGSSPQTYTIEYCGYYISAQAGGTGFDSSGTNLYDEYEVIPLTATTFNIFSPYLQAYNGYGYLCVTFPDGPYVQFCTSAYTWTLTNGGSPTPTPSPSPPPSSSWIEATGTYAGWYLNNDEDPYLTETQVTYTITWVSGSTYTISNGGEYISAQVEGSGFSTAGASQSYNLFQFEPQSSTTFYIFSQYLYNYNGYGYLCVISTPYGPYWEFCTGAYKWSLS